MRTRQFTGAPPSFLFPQKRQLPKANFGKVLAIKFFRITRRIHGE